MLYLKKPIIDSFLLERPHTEHQSQRQKLHPKVNSRGETHNKPEHGNPFKTQGYSLINLKKTKLISTIKFGNMRGLRMAQNIKNIVEIDLLIPLNHWF